MSKKGRYTRQIIENAVKIEQLKKLTDEKVKGHDIAGKISSEAWTYFDSKYAELAFPGGYPGCYERIQSGELEAMEAAICFLECRPKFFGSIYIYQDIFKIIKSAPLTKEQSERLETVLKAYKESKK